MLFALPNSIVNVDFYLILQDKTQSFSGESLDFDTQVSCIFAWINTFNDEKNKQVQSILNNTQESNAFSHDMFSLNYENNKPSQYAA